MNNSVLIAEEMATAYQQVGKSCNNCFNTDCPRTPEEKIYDPKACNNWSNEKAIADYCESHPKVIQLVRFK